MSIKSYYCNPSELGLAYLKNDFSRIRENILKGMVPCTFSIKEDGETYGYHIHDNVPLTKLYGFDVIMVDFVFSKAETLHEPKQLEIMSTLLESINDYMNQRKGYYIFRLPSHIVDLIKAYNGKISGSIFCGGLVTYISTKKEELETTSFKSKVIYPDHEYIEKNLQKLIDISKDAFSLYQGQYHISPVTECKAGEMYEDWFKRAFEPNTGSTILVAEYEGNPASVWIHEEDDFCGKIVLSGVSSKFREVGAYTATLIEAWNISARNNKYLIAGTQFDNFIVQGVWSKLGMKPFLSYYNFHVDRK